MPQFGASLNDDSRVIIYYINMFIIQATGVTASTATVTVVSSIMASAH